MKALIQFEINSHQLNDEQLKDRLINTMVELCEQWIKGDAALYIDFIKTIKDEDIKHYKNNNLDTN
tara:strand:- start:242 stop:439 length:198 start_codon:yes stop_codon:yes gene_type:complete